jgi:hypothetical protein
LLKAEITSAQLRRRYSDLYESIKPESRRLNLVSVARWYASQDPHVRISIEKREPFTWLKHLDKRGTGPSDRLPWHLSALIVEEYTRHKNSNPSATVTSVESLLQSTPPNFISQPSALSLPSRSSLERATSRTHSLEGQVSFEARVDSARNSLDRKSLEGSSRIFKNSLPGRVESRRGSIHSVRSGSSQRNPLGGSSPTSSLLNIRDFAQRLRRRNTQGSDGGLSSARNSASEHSDDEGRRGSTNTPDRIQGPNSPSDREVPSVATGIKFVISSASEGQEAQQTVPIGNLPSTVIHRTVSNHEVDHSSLEKRRSLRGSLDASHRVLGRRRVKTSLPSDDKLSFRKRQLQHLEADEEKISREYERKAQ